MMEPNVNVKVKYVLFAWLVFGMTEDVTSVQMEDFILESDYFPDDIRFSPPIGNGHIATNVLSDTVYMNGLYNGYDDKSSRARIPAYVSVDVTKENDVSRKFALDMYQGLFRQTILTMDLEINVVYFAHRKFTRLLVTRLHMRRRTDSDSNITISLMTTRGPASTDLNTNMSNEGSYEQNRKGHFSGTIRDAETNDTKANELHVYFTPIPETVTLAEGRQEMTLTFYASYSQSQFDALNEFNTGTQNIDTLMESHIQAMRILWEGHIYIKGNKDFMQNVTAAMYNIMCSLPVKDDTVTPFYGLGPGGLSRGGLSLPEKPGGPSNDYAGHIFWDMDMWIMPPIMLFRPDMARRMISSRMRVMDQAKRNAQKDGFDGIKFPWEQAVTGIEVTPKWAGQMSLYQIHVTSDVSYSLRQYVYATDDADIITKDKGFELALEIARFWRSRVAETDNDTVEILGVMGPDEYHYNINNSVFTNYNARLSLLLPRFIIQKFKLSVDASVINELDVFEALASKILILFNEEEQYHPQYDGFSFNYTIKQSDVVLLGFPLMMDMSREVRRNDLELYERVTNPIGPDTGTWSMHTVGWLELGDTDRAQRHLKMMFRNINEPFKVFSEKPVGQHPTGGCVNFITGAGGLLQAMVFGYAGIRLHPDRLAINPYLLPNTTSWGMRGVHYRGAIFDLDFKTDAVTITMKYQPRDYYVYLETDSEEKKKIDIGSTVSFGRPGSRANLTLMKASSAVSYKMFTSPFVYFLSLGCLLFTMI